MISCSESLCKQPSLIYAKKLAVGAAKGVSNVFSQSYEPEHWFSIVNFGFLKSFKRNVGLHRTGGSIIALRL